MNKEIRWSDNAPVFIQSNIYYLWDIFDCVELFEYKSYFDGHEIYKLPIYNLTYIHKQFALLTINEI